VREKGRVEERAKENHNFGLKVITPLMSGSYFVLIQINVAFPFYALSI
jgi:hypothetical protein